MTELLRSFRAQTEFALNGWRVHHKHVLFKQAVFAAIRGSKQLSDTIPADTQEAFALLRELL